MKKLYLSLTLVGGLGLVVALLLLATSLAPAAAQGIVYYVDAINGDDGTGDGSVGNPWQTISHATANVPAGLPGDPNIIQVMPGLYDTTNNGESFPISPPNPDVHLVGSGAMSTTIDGEGAAIILAFGEDGLGVEGFTIQNSTEYAIRAWAGGFSVQNTVISDTLDGISWEQIESVTSNVVLSDVVVSENDFYVTRTGVDVQIELDGSNEAIDITIGAIDLLSNTFYLPSSAGTGVDIDNINIKYLSNGQATVGDVTIAGNEFYGGYDGVSFFGYMDYLTDTLLTVGDVVVADNMFWDTDDSAVDVDYYDVEYLYGTTVGTLGALDILRNEVHSTSATGIEVSDLGYTYDFYDQASVTVGDVTIEENLLDVYDDGVYVYYSSVEYLYDASSVTLGQLFVSNNVITTTYYGIYVETYDTAYDCYSNTVTTMGGFHIDGNHIDSGYEGIYLDLYDLGYYLEDAAVFVMGETTIDGNVINATDDGIYLDFEDVAYDMTGEASFTMGDFYIRDNEVTATDSGLYIYYYDYYVGSYNDGDTYAKLPAYIVTGNTFDVGDDGFYFYTYSNPDDIYDNATVDMGGLTIDDNVFHGDRGIYLYLEDVCEGCYDSTAVTIDDLVVSNNEFYDHTSEAIYAYFDELGYSFDDDATLTMGDFTIQGNYMEGITGTAIYANYSELYSAYTTTVTIGGLNILDNEMVDLASDAIDIYYYLDAEDISTLSVGPAVVRGNTIAGCGQDGIAIDIDRDIDPGAILIEADPLIARNVVSNCEVGVYLASDTDATVVNNALVDISAVGLWIDTDGTVPLVHNTISAAAPAGQTGIEVRNSTALITNTVVVSQSVGISVTAGSTALVDAVLWYGNVLDAGGAGTITVTGAITGWPALMPDGYHLLETSPAIDAGVDAGVTSDIDGEQRPFGSGFDLGADEYRAPGGMIYLPVVLRNS